MRCSDVAAWQHASMKLSLTHVRSFIAIRTCAWLSAMAFTASTALSAPPPERTLKLKGDLLLLPVSDHTALKKGEETADAGLLEVMVDGTLVHRVNAIFPRKVEDAKFWAFLDMKEFKGKDAILRIPRGPAVLRGAEILGRMESGDTMRHTQPIYKEGGRLQFHFSQIQGWNNDPNGMVYADGLWHLSWQCNPVGTGFGGWYGIGAMR
jgi:hypothetical protein